MVRYIPPGPEGTTPAQQLAALQRAERRWAYVLCRTVLGLVLVGYGLADVLGEAKVAFQFGIAWTELAAGMLLVASVWTRPALILAMLLSFALSTEAALAQHWAAVALHLLYALLPLALLVLRTASDVSWRRLLGSSTRPG